MSTLWTPDGERPIRRQPDAPPQPPPPSEPPGAGAGGGGAPPGAAEAQAELDELARQLAAAPPEVVIANHAYGLFQLAAVHLSQRPPQLSQAKLAIDALGALVEGLAGRLGEPERDLIESLAQLRMAFVQIQRTPEPSPE